jgi:hypothetical protein
MSYQDGTTSQGSESIKNVVDLFVLFTLTQIEVPAYNVGISKNQLHRNVLLGENVERKGSSGTRRD